MSANASRGEREVNLGKLGRVLCRPSLRALEALDDPKRTGPLTVMLERMAIMQSLRDTVDILYETHLDARADCRFSRSDIGEAVLEVGMDSLREDCFNLIRTAWSTTDEGETDSGNE